MKELKTQNKISYFRLFIELFLINAFTFGGGYTIIPIIKDKFVKDLGLITEKDMIESISLATTVPGAMAISTSYLVGNRVRGYIGGIVAVIASVSPCIVSISIIFLMYSKFIKNIYVIGALRSIASMVSAILFVTVINMINKMNKKLTILFLISLVASYIYKIDIIFILIFSAIVGIVYNKIGDKK